VQSSGSPPPYSRHIGTHRDVATAGAFDWTEWDRLTTALNARGVLHVAPLASAADPRPISDAELFRDLRSSRDPRLREAAIALLIVRPELAPAARAAIDSLVEPDRERATLHYVAASALQRMWRTRLRLNLGDQPLIPPAFVDEWKLRPLDEDFGRRTLWCLAGIEEARHGYDAWAGYTSLMDLLLAEIAMGGWRRRRA
jgi:hypothetical protein